MLANARIDAGETTAGLLRARRLTAQHIHVRGWAAKVGDHTGEAWHRVANRFDLIDDRIFRAALNNTAFVLGNRAERAPYNSDHLEIFLRLKSMN